MFFGIDRRELLKDCVLSKSEIFAKLREKNLGRIAEAIDLTWGHNECDAYLSKLIISDRDNRVGFEPEVFNMLLRLQKLHTADLRNLQKQEDRRGYLV